MAVGKAGMKLIWPNQVEDATAALALVRSTTTHSTALDSHLDLLCKDWQTNRQAALSTVMARGHKSTKIPGVRLRPAPAQDSSRSDAQAARSSKRKHGASSSTRPS